MKLNVWLGTGVLLFLTGCGAGFSYDVNYAPYDLREPSRVIKNPSDVLIISDITKTDKPYKEIGILEVGASYTSFSRLVEDLRTEAAKRGADAVINIQETSDKKTGWTNYGNVGSGWIGGTPGTLIGGNFIGGTPGYYNAGVPLMFPNNTTILKVRGTAIIFLEEK